MARPGPLHGAACAHWRRLNRQRVYREVAHDLQRLLRQGVSVHVQQPDVPPKQQRGPAAGDVMRARPVREQAVWRYGPVR